MLTNIDLASSDVTLTASFVRTYVRVPQRLGTGLEHYWEVMEPLRDGV